MTIETARTRAVMPENMLYEKFADAEGRCNDALFTNAAMTRVLGITGLPFHMPVCNELLNDPGFLNWFEPVGESVLIEWQEDRCRAFTESSGETSMSEDAARSIMNAVRRLKESPGRLNEKGELIIDLKSQNVGLHYPVNLLLGDRSRFEFPLVTTPKSSVDALGRGSFRAAGGDQVLATRYTLHPEENGEPANRQFYLYEDGKQIFWSADVNTNVESGSCRHSHNRTVITYRTSDGLEITRTIFILPQEKGLPEAVEAQRISIRDLAGRDREIRIDATGVFGMMGPDKFSSDVMYVNLVAEGALLMDEGRPAATMLSSKPAEDRLQRRFAMILSDGEPMDGFCQSLSEFIGTGSLAHPEHGLRLSSTLQRKTASFFAISRNLRIPAGGEAVCDVFTGLCYAGGPVRAADLVYSGEAYKADPAEAAAAEKEADERIYELYRRFRDPDALSRVMTHMEESWKKYSGYLLPETGDSLFDSYVSGDLPFQVLYQTYVSRAFAWTQKAYRETGFREIQDIYASMYYLSASGQNDLVRELIGSWVRNVCEMGYANHNFTFRGKEPGLCSDDQLWLIQAVYRYVHLTGDTGFLTEEFDIADTQGKRSLWDTVRAILTYSGRISVGKHGLPLLDTADWNDTLRLDHGVLNGPGKKAAYRAQLERSGAQYGTPLENTLSESVMNAFLLKIAADETAELASMTGDNDMKEFACEISECVLESCRKHAWKDDFYARCLMNDDRPYTYLGAGGDGLSADPEVPGSYFLNSYSWSILADAADEEQIRIMLGQVNRYLRTDAGLRLCTLIAFERLGINTGTSLYFPGDRENCGVFKHAAMMAAVASLKAAKKVSDGNLADDLRELAFFMMDKTLPYRTLEDPFVYKGNPRFCTQYNNSETGENIGPMLSGTASWLTLGIYEHLGIDVRKDEIAFDPILRPDTDGLCYTANLGDAVLHVKVTGREGRYRVGKESVFKADGKEFSGTMPRPHSGETEIVIEL